MTEYRAQLYNLTEAECDTVVWRYLTFPKFISLVAYGALWFSKLTILSDEFEGRLPAKTEARMKLQNQEWKQVFQGSDFHAQIDEWPARNVADGRALSLVNCWFIGEHESERMWGEYVPGGDGVAVRSTIRKVRDSVYLNPEWSFIGKVQYVNFSTFDMSSYHGSQAHHRAFLKDEARFAHESELRIETMNTRTPFCLDSLGRPLSPQDLTGVGMNNPDDAGLFIRANLESLFDHIILHPKIPRWIENLVMHIRDKSGLGWTVTKSELCK